jgi:hypothetical protein
MPRKPKVALINREIRGYRKLFTRLQPQQRAVVANTQGNTALRIRPRTSPSANTGPDLRQQLLLAAQHRIPERFFSACHSHFKIGHRTIRAPPRGEEPPKFRGDARPSRPKIDLSI